MTKSADTDEFGAQHRWAPESVTRRGEHHLRLAPSDGTLTRGGVPAGPIFGGTVPRGSVLDFPALLLGVLGFSGDEFVSICHKNSDGTFRTAVCAPGDAMAHVKALPRQVDIYFGVNPVKGPARRNGGRGKAEHVTRLSALVADLDVKSGACPNLEVAKAIIDDLSAILGTPPSAVTHSGGGLHVYWPISDGRVDGDLEPAEVLKRWGRLVQAVAERRGVKADTVFDLPRVLRVPGTYNCKAASNIQGRIRVFCYTDGGSALTLTEVTRRLDAYGIHQLNAYPDPGAQLSDPDGWESATETCDYMTATISGWSDPNTVAVGNGRHPWLLSQAVRLNCAKRLGCITEADFDHAKDIVEKTFTHLCRAREPLRDPAPGEISDIWKTATVIAAAKTVQQARAELGGHRHLWPAPDHPYQCAKQVVALAKREGRPLRYWNGTWFAWCGTHYRRTMVEELRDRLYEVLADAEYLGAKGDKLRWKPTPKKLNDAIDAARGLVTLPAGVGASEWIDGHKEQVIACANGLVRVADRALLTHTPEFFNTFALPFDYEPDADKPERWLKFLKEVFPDDPESAKTLQEWFGYILSGRTDLQKMLMVVGPPRSGKGTIVRTLTELVGEAACAAVTDTALAGEFGLAPLVDKALAVFSDTRVTIKGKKLVETLLSVTGEDTVPINRKYRDAVSVRLTARFMIMSNEPPLLPDNSGAIVSRMIALSTPRSFVGREDTGLSAALRKELPAILDWALDGMNSLAKSGRFIQPTSGQAIVGLMSEGASPIKQFVDAECVFGSHDTHCVSKAMLYDRYRSWCAEHGHPAHSDVHLARALYAAYGTRIASIRRGGRGERHMYFSGITLRPGDFARSEQ